MGFFFDRKSVFDLWLELTYSGYAFKSASGSNKSAHVSNRPVSRDEKQTLLNSGTINCREMSCCLYWVSRCVYIHNKVAVLWEEIINLMRNIPKFQLWEFPLIWSYHIRCKAKSMTIHPSKITSERKLAYFIWIRL